MYFFFVALFYALKRKEIKYKLVFQLMYMDTWRLNHIVSVQEWMNEWMNLPFWLELWILVCF